MREQKTTFKTKSTTQIGAICDMIQQSVEKYYKFKVLSVIPLKDFDELWSEVQEYRIEYLDSNNKPQLAFFKLTQVLSLIGEYVRAPEIDV